MLSIGVSLIQSCSSTENSVVESTFIFVLLMSKYNRFTNESVMMDDMPVARSTRIRSWLKYCVFRDVMDELSRFKYRHFTRFTSQIYVAVVSLLASNSRLVSSKRGAPP